MITELKNLLDCLDCVGIDTAVLEPNEEKDGSMVRGTDDARDVIVFDTCDFGPFSDHPIGIQSVKALKSRLELFDSKANVSFTDDGEAVTNINVKKGRSSVNYRCSSPDSLSVPSATIDGLEKKDSEAIFLSKEYVGELVRAIQSISQTGQKDNQTISVSVSNHTANIVISDGENDSFRDEVENVNLEESDKYAWDVKAFHRVMKNSLDNHSETSFNVSQYGTAMFTVGFIDVIICPFA